MVDLEMNVTGRKERPMHTHQNRKFWKFLLPLVLLLPLLLTAFGSESAQTKAGLSAEDPPIPHITIADRGWVDTTGSVSQTLLNQLRDKSDEIIKGGNQLAGVFLHDTASEPALYGTNVFNVNGIGSKQTNNGILIMVLLDRAGTDGTKPYLQIITGSGTERYFTDTQTADFREQYFNPYRARGQWQDGLVNLTAQIATFLQTNPDAQQNADNDLANYYQEHNGASRAPGQGQAFDYTWLWLLVPLIAGLLVWFFTRWSGRGRGPGGPNSYPGIYYGGGGYPGGGFSGGSYGGGGGFSGGSYGGGGSSSGGGSGG
jgi:uncharacterized protein